MDPTLLVFLTGTFVGLLIGRVWTERARAHYDMDRVWDARKNYRDD